MTGPAMKKVTEEFRREAVRIALTSGRTVGQVAFDLGIGKSTLGKWISRHREADLLSGPHDDVQKELARLRKENEILRQERDLLKKSSGLLCSGDKSMMFRVIDEKKADLSLNRKCALFGVSASGYYAWKLRRPSKRQLDDMVFLAHIRSQFTTSHETYGSPRMHIELQEDGFVIGLPD